MLDRILNIGSTMNWVSPLFSFFADAVNRSVCDFGITAYAGVGIRDIKTILKSYNIKVWGVMYNFEGDILMFSVREDQADLTYDVLVNMGIPIEYSSVYY